MFAALLLSLSLGADAPASQPASQAAEPLAVDVGAEIDRGLELAHDEKFSAAAEHLYLGFAAMSDADLKRDAAQLSLAETLIELGLDHGAIEHLVDIAASRRSPEMVARALGLLSELTKQGTMPEERLIDQVLFGGQYGELPPETESFVEYYQALAEMRRGYEEWALRRLEALIGGEDASKDYYAYKARYLLAVNQLQRHNDEGAHKLFTLLAEAADTPREVKNDARTALGRLSYERKQFVEAFAMYASIDAPLDQQDVVLLEKAWTKVASRDERRALGMIVGLGAPIYGHLSAPERELIRAIALDRLCQFRAAHLTVLGFRNRYRETLERIRSRGALDGDALLRRVALSQSGLLATETQRRQLVREQRAIGVVSGPLRDHLEEVYQLRLAQTEGTLARGMDRALIKAAEELLRIDEQMSILDYEIGVGIFKRGRNPAGRKARGKVADEHGPAPLYYRFTGEYWSDELTDFSVLVDDRCVP